MDEYNAVMRVYDPDVEMAAAIKELQGSGFGVNQLSIVGKDYRTKVQDIGHYNAGDRMKVWCRRLENSWGGLSVWVY